jgi:NAD(P)-dependent dehydrogenase (short-subunit alcohol dehydrogenase family)
MRPVPEAPPDARAVPGRQRGRHVAVTGASRGIGRAIALRLASEGATLSLLMRDPAGAASLLDTCRTRGAGAVAAFRCDVTDREFVDAAFGAAADAHGPLHACVANAGVGGPNRPGPDDRWDSVIATNLTGVYATFRAAERVLAPGPAPRQFIALSSILGRIGVDGYTAYCASKAGVLGLVRALAMELADERVHVNALCPGWVDTDMAWEGIDGIARAIDKDRDAAYRLAMRDVPLKRMSAAADVAGLVAYLLSDDAVGITGQALDINNGAFML